LQKEGGDALIVAFRNAFVVILGIFLFAIGLGVWSHWVFQPNPFWQTLAALIVGTAIIAAAYFPIRLTIIRKVMSTPIRTPDFRVAIGPNGDATYWKGEAQASQDEFIHRIKMRSMKRVILDLSIIVVLGAIEPALLGSALDLGENWSIFELSAYTILFVGIFGVIWFDIRSTNWWSGLCKSIIAYELPSNSKNSIPFQNIGAGIQRLSECEILMEVSSREGVSDWKRNAGVSLILGFNNARGKLVNDFLDADIISLNVDVPAIKMWRQSWFTEDATVVVLLGASIYLSLGGIQTLLISSIPLTLFVVSYFLLRGSYWVFAPDGILVNKSGPRKIYPYSAFKASTKWIQLVWTGLAVSGRDWFRDEKDLPEDALVTHQTWRYVNADGGPDRRFKDNYQLDVILCGVITFGVSSPRSEERKNLSLQTSNWYLPLECSDYWFRSGKKNLTKDPLDTLAPIIQKEFGSLFKIGGPDASKVKELKDVPKPAMRKGLKIPQKPTS
jgi:hypothetical protein